MMVRWAPLLVAVALVGGCGDEPREERSDAEAEVARAAQVSSGYGARFVVRGSITEHGETTDLTGTGSAEAGGRRDRFTLDVDGTEVEQITDGPFVLVRVEGLSADALPAGTPPGTRWIKFNQERLLEQQGLSGSALRELQSSDPAQQLAILGSLADETEREGEERVRGVQTTRYRLIITGEDLIKRLSEGADNPPPPSDAVREARFPFVIWVDRTGRVRKAHFTFAAEGTGVDFTSEVVALERGLRVRMPPESEVYDATEEALEEAPDRD